MSRIVIIPLPPSLKRDMEVRNIGRSAAGIRPLQLAVRRCPGCGYLFETVGNKTCGCGLRGTGPKKEN